MASETKPTCPHCGAELRPWRSPDMTTWEGRTQFVCFNDDCGYYRRGWEWMKSKYNVVASYRHRLDPATGEQGPLPVWSPAAMKHDIIEPEEENP